MRIKKLHKHMKDTFFFDVNLERTVYSYVCKEKIARKQKKLLTEDIKFTTYRDWKKYIVDRYSGYSVESITEFVKAINVLFREAEKTKDYSQNIGVAYVSAVFAVILAKENVGLLENGLGLLIMPAFCVFIIKVVYSLFTIGHGTVEFYTDVSDILHEIIKEKKSTKP